ncbi:MAG TPA: type II secretion system protein N [Burkholderiales bacterium]|nr:type II secretion system protein N [Burkholderiales bacterium]
MKRWIVLGVVLTLLAIAAQFPAAWLAPAVERGTSARWRVADATGTAWRGRATLYSYDRTTGYWAPARVVSWHTLWGRLASGVIASQLQFDDGGKAQLAASFNGWSLENVDATFPAAQLAVLLPSTIGDYGWAGMFAARTSAFRCTWGRPNCTGQVELGWNDAATVQIPGPPLGDYAIRIVAEGDALRFAVTTLRGRLHVTGAGEISRSRLRFTGEARSDANDDVRLESLLRVIGRPGAGPGRYLIEYADAAAAR